MIWRCREGFSNSGELVIACRSVGEDESYIELKNARSVRYPEGVVLAKIAYQHARQDFSMGASRPLMLEFDFLAFAENFPP